MTCYKNGNINIDAAIFETKRNIEFVPLNQRKCILNKLLGFDVAYTIHF